MHAVRTGGRTIGAITALLVALATLTLATTSSQQQAQAQTPEEPVLDAREHPFSDPTHYPLRSSELDDVRLKDEYTTPGPWSSVVACVVTNCDIERKVSEEWPNGPHGVWAIDFVADYNDDVYAAGAGVFHIGEDSDDCTSEKGRWGWIDHGGGIVSRYHHLSDILLVDGTRVTPATQIAELGHGCTSTVDYLHFEVRRGGVRGTRYNPGNLIACNPDGTRSAYPRDLPLGPFESWDHIPWRKEQGAIPQAVNCDLAVPATPDAVPSTTARFGNQWAKIWWPAPSTTSNRVTVEMQMWKPRVGAFSEPTYSRYDETVRSAAYRGLDNGRRYRFRVAYHNAAGNARWGPAVIVNPGAAPSRPALRNLSTAGRRVTFAWTKPDSNGRRIRTYNVAIRRRTENGWTTWKAKTLRAGDGKWHAWDGLRPGTVYAVTVRATNALGTGPWSSRYRIKTNSAPPRAV